MNPSSIINPPSSRHRLGWRPDVPDQRDHVYLFSHTAAVPPRVDLREHCPPVYDQGELGSCTANSIAGAIDFERLKQGLPGINPSRLFIYYNERDMEGTIDSDSGAMIRDGIKSVGKLGVCPELEWLYDITKFQERPPTGCYADALKSKAVLYKRINQTLQQLKGCLAEGYPFVFGFSVYESFESEEVARTGTAPLPAFSEQCLGGHAVMCVGYEDSPLPHCPLGGEGRGEGAVASSRFIVRNSWGEGWGDNGYFTLPYEYLTNPNLADDFWTIRLVN